MRTATSLLQLGCLGLTAALWACSNAAPRVSSIPPLAEMPVESPELARPLASPDEPPAAASPPEAPRPLEHSAALSRLFAALADLEKGRRSDDVHIVQFGDSHTAADYETGPLRRALQRRFGDGGRGFVALGRPWKPYTQDGIVRTGMSGWTEERGHFVKGKFAGDGRYGLLGVAIATSRKGADAFTDLSNPSPRVEVAYLEQPRGGSLDLLVDGSRVRRIQTAGPEERSAYATVDVSEGPHRLEVRAAGDGSIRVFGMTLDSPRVGVTLDALGVNGARAGDLLRLDEAGFVAELRHRDPALVILAYGTNESADALPVQVHERQIVEVLGRVARAVPTASCLLIGPPDRAEKHRVVSPPPATGKRATVETVWTSCPRVSDIAVMERKVAEAAGCAYFSELEVMGGPGSMAAWAVENPPRAMLDRTHLTRQGYQELGEALASEIIKAYEATRSAR